MTQQSRDRGQAVRTLACRRSFSIELGGLPLAAVLLSTGAAPPPTVEWTMVNVNAGYAQADAHLIRVPDGGYQMIDAGDNEDRLVPYLRQRGVKRIERVFISHLHKDHYRALPAIVEAGIEIGEVYVNYPERSVCDGEVPWGCDFADIERTIAHLKKKGVSVIQVAPGQVVYSQDGVRLRVLYAYSGIDSPVGRTDVNDTSVIMALEFGKTRVLFTGDLNSSLGTYLASDASDLKADILKVPHHGTESVAPNDFFDQVGASVALVPSPRNLWLSDRSQRIRRYFNRKRTRTFVNGICGHTTVLIRQNDFTVNCR